MKTILFKNPAATDSCRIVVHGGQFHADDVLAVLIAMLRYGDVEVIRAFEVREEYFEGGATFVVDVGMKYDGEIYFDHHQDSVPVYEDGVMACGATLFAQKVLSEDLYEFLYEKTLRAVAVQDNGQKELFALYPNLLFGWVHSMNPLWDSTESPDEAFEKAVRIGFPILQQLCAAFDSKNKAQNILNDAEELENGKILILPQFVPWHEYAVEKEAALFVVHPSNRGGFMVQCVPPTKEDWTLQRQPLPEEWVSGEKPEGCSFCHKNLFCASFGTQEQAITALKGIL